MQHQRRTTVFTRLRALLGATLLTAAIIAPPVALAQSAPATDSAPISQPAPAKETVDNPYGLDALWKGGDFVAKGTLAILVIMSAGSWYVIFTKLYEQTKLARQGRQAH